MSYIALARQVQIYRNISDPIGRLGSWSFWYIVLQLAKHYTPLQCIVIHRTAEKNRKVGVAETINIWTDLRRHLLLPAAPIQLKFLCSALAKTIFAFVVIICGPLWLTYLLPQVFDVLKHIFVKYIGNISGVALDISLLNISAIYRDWLHSLGTRSAGKFLKVASTSLYITKPGKKVWPKKSSF